MEDAKAQLKGGVKKGVDMTNKMLASVQQATMPVGKAFAVAEREGTNMMNTCSDLYKKRKQYGPHIVGGSAVVAGGITAMRRGRIPGLVAATLVGGVATLAVYEVNLSQAAEKVFGKK